MTLMDIARAETKNCELLADFSAKAVSHDLEISISLPRTIKKKHNTVLDTKYMKYIIDYVIC